MDSIKEINVHRVKLEESMNEAFLKFEKETGQMIVGVTREYREVSLKRKVMLRPKLIIETPFKS